MPESLPSRDTELAVTKARVFVPPLVVLAFFAAWAGEVRADFLDFRFSGTITAVNDTARPVMPDGSPPIQLLSGLIAVGDAFEATLTVDRDSVVSNQASRFALRVATPNWVYDDPRGTMGEFFLTSGLLFISHDAVPVSGRPLLAPPLATNVSLTGQSLSITGFTLSNQYNNPRFEILGVVSRLQAVPEPGSAVLVLLGIACGVWHQIRRSRPIPQ